MKGKGRHVPQRMCVICREVQGKRALIRIVRTPDDGVLIDTTGKRAGRGAYLCHSATCWDQALRRNGLTRALRVEALHPEDRAALEQFARGLALAEEPAGPLGADAA